MDSLGSKNSLTVIPKTKSSKKKMLAIHQRNTMAGIPYESEKYFLFLVLIAIIWRLISKRNIFHWKSRPASLETLRWITDNEDEQSTSLSTVSQWSIATVNFPSRFVLLLYNWSNSFQENNTFPSSVTIKVFTLHISHFRQLQKTQHATTNIRRQQGRKECNKTP
jgi:hypothetical protein